MAAGVLIWRLEAHEGDLRSGWRETVAHRVIGATFAVLPVYIAAEGAHATFGCSDPEVSRLGLALALLSSTVMPSWAC